MKIVLTAKEVTDKGIEWERFCELMGLNEGMDSSREFTITEEQAKELGFILRGRRGKAGCW